MTNPNDQKEELFHFSITENLEENKKILEKAFRAEKNKDFIFRDIFVKEMKCEGLLIYINGTIDNKTLEEFVIQPLLHMTTPNRKRNSLQHFCQQIITSTKSTSISVFAEMNKHLLDGNVVLLMPGFAEAVSIRVAGFESRTIEKPENEAVVKGPKEAFVESKHKNLTLIRKHLRDRSLVTENMDLGKIETNEISFMYIDSIADPDLVREVKKRCSQIEADAVEQLSILEQHIEERPYSLVPSCMLTERPDRAAAFLREGHVIILDDQSPYALITPITFWSLFHTSEDYYQRWAYGNFIRIVRFLAVMIALLTPSFYIAISNYHAEMLPTDLLLAIAATREVIPFPVVIEVLIMELAFELLREAGVRIPSVIGPTIGIVGALILGQAAVEANIVSPIMVLVVAITGLSSFAIPEVSFSFIVRILRFGFLLVAAVFGFFGMSLFMAAILAYLVSVQTFGVAFFSPLAPYSPSSKDFVVRPPIWKLWLRPLNLHPKQQSRKADPEKGGYHEKT
ncbi:spore germination protein [Halobacillus trueperi]|uniref:spore germination protein n=1 Tax=Halobacillus trueperi TaxID=156205 RepID=UPI003734EBB7